MNIPQSETHSTLHAFPDALVQLASPAEIAAMQHPRDPAVLQTTRRDVFEAAAQHSHYRAAILKRSGAEIERLRSEFAEIAPAFFGYYHILETTIDANGVIDLDDPGNIFAPVHSELRDMVSTYNRITGAENNHIYFKTNMDSELAKPNGHDHPYPVINGTWGRPGVMWWNEQGEKLQVDEADWFFFQKGVPHTSPRPDKRALRLTTAVHSPDLGR